MTEPLDHKGVISKVAISADGSRVLAVGGQWDTHGQVSVYRGSGATVWDTNTGRLLLEVRSHAAGHSVWDASLSADGSRLVTCAEGDADARVWAVRTGKELVRLHTPGVIAFVLFNTDGSRFVTVQSQMAGAQQWDTRTGEPVGEWMPAVGNRADGVRQPAAYSRDGRVLALADGDRFVTIDAATGKMIAESTDYQLPIPGQTFCSVELSEDGSVLSTTAIEYGSRAWRTATAAPLTDILQDFAGTPAVIRPDGKYMLCGGGADTAGIWDVSLGTRIAVIGGDGDFQRSSFSPDGLFIATTHIGHGGTTAIWKTQRER